MPPVDHTDTPRPLHLVLLEDDPVQLRLLERVLQHLCGGTIRGFQDGFDMLSYLALTETPVDAVFCDLQVPKLDGVQVIRLLAERAFPGWLVLISAEDTRLMATVRQVAISHGLAVMPPMAKPVGPAALRTLIDELRTPPPLRQARPIYRDVDLQTALARGELVNVYQPKVNARTGEWEGVEALVRWRHGIDGWISPEHFISLAEQHGLIDQLTRTVIVNALQDARAWHDAGWQPALSINVSMDNLTQVDFPDWVLQQLSQSCVSLGRFNLEVTESRLMDQPKLTLEVLSRLRLHKIQLAIDDFGTGHSSLRQLLQVPFHELKLDQGFVNGISRDSSAQAIFDASILMARKLHMRTVAEGVETPEDLDYVRASGCDAVQGYLIARPMASADLIAWADQWPTQRAQLWPAVTTRAG